MCKDILTFGDTEVEKYEFYCHKRPIFLKDVGIEEVLVSKKISSDEKKTIIALLVTCITIIKLSRYIKYFLKQALT